MNATACNGAAGIRCISALSMDGLFWRGTLASVESDLVGRCGNTRTWPGITMSRLREGGRGRSLCRTGW